MPFVPERFKAEIRALEEILDPLEAFAKDLVPTETWVGFSDDDLVRLIYERRTEPGIQMARLAEIAHSMLEDFRFNVPLRDQHQRQEYLALLMVLLQTAAVQEFERRRAKITTPDGRATLDFLDWQDEESRKSLVRHATRGLRWHPEYHSERDATEEISAEADVELTARLRPIMNASDPLGERMRACLSGMLNRVPNNARKAALGKLERVAKEARERKIAAFDEKMVDRKFTAPSSWEKQRVLLDECLEGSDLTSEEKVLVELRIAGHTEKEIAERLHVTQPAVNQRLARIRSKLVRIINTRSSDFF